MSYYKCDCLRLENWTSNFSQHVVVILGLTLDKLEVLPMGPVEFLLKVDAKKLPQSLFAPKHSEMGDDE